jgi:hypothetical protein
MATFWHTFNHTGKISLVRVEGARPSIFTISDITRKVVVYTPAERENTLPPISPLPLDVLCGYSTVGDSKILLMCSALMENIFLQMYHNNSNLNLLRGEFPAKWNK